MEVRHYPHDKLEFGELLNLDRAAVQQRKTNQPFGVFGLRRVSFPTPEKTRKGRLRGFSLEIPLSKRSALILFSARGY